MAEYKDYQDWYKNYLLDQLNICKAELGFNDFIIRVAKERSYELPKEPNELLFVIKNITGSYVLGIKTQPVQIMCYTQLNTIDIAYQILDLFVKLHHQNQFHENSNLVKEDYDTPVVLKPFVESSDGFRMSLYAMGSYVICENVADIQKLQWKNDNNIYEDINYISADLSYGAVLQTSKISGQQLSTSAKQEAGTTLSITMMNYISDFCKKINQIVFGSVNGNTTFSLLYKINDVEYQKDFKLEGVQLSGNRTDAPGLVVSFRI